MEWGRLGSSLGSASSFLSQDLGQVVFSSEFQFSLITRECEVFTELSQGFQKLQDANSSVPMAVIL